MYLLNSYVFYINKSNYFTFAAFLYSLIGKFFLTMNAPYFTYNLNELSGLNFYCYLHFFKLDRILYTKKTGV